MSLIINATASDENANSYCTVDEALVIADYILEGETFKSIPDDQKGMYLVRATEMLELHMVNATTQSKTDSVQALLFPSGGDLTVPKAIRKGLVAQAAYMFQNRDQFYQSMNDAGVDFPLSENSFKAPNMISRAAQYYIKPFYRFKGLA